MKKFIQYTPFTLWVIYVLCSFKRSNELASARLEAISLSRDLTVGGYPQMLNIAAYTSFFDEIALLVLAFVVYHLLKKRNLKIEITSD